MCLFGNVKGGCAEALNMLHVPHKNIKDKPKQTFCHFCVCLTAVGM